MRTRVARPVTASLLLVSTLTATATGSPLVAQERTAAAAPTSSEATVAAPDDALHTDIERIFGKDRYATAAAVALHANPAGAERVYLATGRNFPDALAAGPVAGMADAPILLTATDALPAPTAATLELLRPSRVTVLGGAAAVTEQVLAEVQQVTGVAPERISGPDRYATAAAVSSGAFAAGVDRVYVATGRNYPDALAGGAAGALVGAPILLTATDTLPDVTAEELSRLAPSTVVVLGGTTAVADGVLDQIEQAVGAAPSRLAGPDRYATAATVAADAFTGPVDLAVLATGAGFPDALAGAPLAAGSGGPVLLTRRDCLPAVVADQLRALAPAVTDVLGGRAAVADTAAQLTGCDDQAEVPPVSVSVDESVEPSQPGLGKDRQLAAVRTDAGVLDVVAGRVVVVGTTAQAERVAERVNGAVVETTTAAGMLPLHTVQAGELAPVDPTDVEDLLRHLDPQSAGRVAASDEQMLALMAAVAELRAAGLVVSVNPVLENTDVASGSLHGGLPVSGRNSPGSSYDRDMATWVHLYGKGAPYSGVLEAWRAIELSGRARASDDTRRIPIAILDGGFYDHSDLPDARRGVNSVPNSGTCSGNPCPFHGTGVALTATGLVNDDGKGAGGVAGQVAQPWMYGPFPDLESILEEGYQAITDGAKIMNMSGTARLSAIESIVAAPAALLTEALADHGVLIFASAGNDGDHIDAEDCFIVCWEEELFIPCELGGVVCVGGTVSVPTPTPRSNVVAASGSNHGGDVDLWAPFTVFVGEDPVDGTESKVQKRSGTSYSSPFAAGAAALVKAANPNLRRDEILDILHDTAGRPDDGRVGRSLRVNRAVVRALGGNRPFTAESYLQHWGGAIHDGQDLPVRIDVADPDTTPTIEWRIDGGDVLSTSADPRVRLDSRTYAVGKHTVAATVTDGIYSWTRSVTFFVENTPPEGQIIKPTGDGTVTYYASEPVPLRAEASDVDRDVADQDIQWVTEGGAVIRLGRTPAALVPNEDLAGPGTYTLELRVVDKDANGHPFPVDSVTFTVEPDPSDTPPKVAIIDPADGSSTSYPEETVCPVENSPTDCYAEVVFSAMKWDDESGAQDLTLEWWAVSWEDGQPQGLRLDPVAQDENTATFRLTHWDYYTDGSSPYSDWRVYARVHETGNTATGTDFVNHGVFGPIYR